VLIGTGTMTVQCLFYYNVYGKGVLLHYNKISVRLEPCKPNSIHTACC